MAKQFNPRTIWLTLRSDLKAGQSFQTWSNTGRAQGVRFSIVDIDAREIVIKRENDGKTYKNFRASVEGMAEVWDDYLAGSYPRSDMGKFTFASSYVLGIFASRAGLA
ncbi:MAG TPA: hypothetical protein VGO52_11400 [Hyphomonadaceae bacterium]|jgi:hypothetical protein|nr:hypothetical protein [Hyphomonadaceae bacterium]